MPRCSDERRLAEVNEGAPERQRVTPRVIRSHRAERELAEGLSIAEVAILERDMARN